MKGMFLFQTAGIAERSREQVVATLKSGGVTHLLLKAMDGNSWEGYWDHSPIEVNSIDDLKLWRDVCEASGISLMPWVQPDDPGYNTDMNVQVARYAEIAREFGVYNLDVEPGSDYWYTLDMGNVGNEIPFLTQLHQAAPNAKMIINFPGSWAWGQMTPFILAATRSGLDIEWWIQSYWDVATAKRDESKLRALVGDGVEVQHIIGTNPNFQSMLAWLQPRGNVHVWDFAHMNMGMYSALKGFVSSDPLPGPIPPGGTWQSPGFSELFKSTPEMGTPNGDAYADSLGNVWQDSNSGRALWVKDFNKCFWLGK